MKCPHCAHDLLNEAVIARRLRSLDLTGKEIHIVLLFLRGKSLEQIAAEMGMRPHNVTVRLYMAKQKISVNTDLELVLTLAGFMTPDRDACPARLMQLAEAQIA